MLKKINSCRRLKWRRIVSARTHSIIYKNRVFYLSIAYVLVITAFVLRCKCPYQLGRRIYCLITASSLHVILCLIFIALSLYISNKRNMRSNFKLTPAGELLGFSTDIYYLRDYLPVISYRNFAQRSRYQKIGNLFARIGTCLFDTAICIPC